MKYSASFLLISFPTFLIAGTGETIQVQGFYAALVAVLLLVLFYDKIKKGLKLTWIRFSHWFIERKDSVLSRNTPKNDINEYVLVQKTTILFD